MPRARACVLVPPATDRGRRREGEEGEEGEEGRDNKRRPRDLVAALGALADSVPPPTLVGACLGYPRVYAWSKAGDVAAAARALSSETLRVYEVYARFRGDEKNAPPRRVCGFTAPARFGEDDAETVARDRDANAWLEAMRERAAAGGDVWTDLRLSVETRSAGPVAL